MSLLTPDSGLLFWMLITFGIVVFVLTKYGFPIILKMVEDRKTFIEDSILMAEKARTELQLVKKEGEAIIENARKEHLKIVENATLIKDKIVDDAKKKATLEATKIVEDARSQILIEKEDALREIRSQVSELSVVIAEKVLRNQLDNKTSQTDMINRLLDEINIIKS